MLIKNLIKKLKSNYLDNSLSSIDIKGIACDSRKVLPGYLYVAIVGYKQDGHDFINQALKNGASALVVNENYKNLKDIKVPIIVVSDTANALVDLANEFYDYPSKKLKIIGITGTNGKTTTTYLLEKILETAGFKVGVIGTVNYRFAGKIINATNTTPGPLELQELLAGMVKQNLDYAVMEVSSHALDQNRVAGIKFRSAIFTNLTQDHLDYHKNLEDYFNAKAKLFKNLDKDVTAIVNIDDIYSEKLIKKIKSRLISYSINKPSNIQAEEIKFSLEKSEFLVKIDRNRDLSISTKLIGIHNVYNILASIACALNEGISLEDIKEGIGRLDFIPGRLQKIDFGQEVSVFVDYAHTPDALRNVLGTMKKIFNKKILVVFGT
ncbi:MAG: UDP-N-acetylmuramoyl-L-alanyl-D-glutamate--2,6-diaminopimelate ligase, partial [Candidatus Omnitrophota bacterium]